MSKGSKIVNAAVAGLDFLTVVISGKAYTLFPPTIEKIAGAGYYLSDVKEGDNIKDILLSLGDADKFAYALSFLINGDDKLHDTFFKADANEVIEAIILSLSMISAENFIRLSVLTKSVAMLTARPK